MNIINKQQVKKMLQIDDIIYDSIIDLFIPVVSDFLTGSNGYLNNNFVSIGIGDTSTGSNQITNSNINAEFGALVEVSGFTNATVLAQEGSTIILDNVSTESNTSTSIKFNNFPYGYKDIVAKLIWYKINRNTIAKATKGDAKSEKIEDYSITYGDDWSVIGSGGYPLALLKGLEPIKKVMFV